MLTGIPEITTARYEDMLRFNFRRRGNIIIFGLGGTGKTQICQEVAHEKHEHLVYVNLSVMEAPDFLGLPWRDEKTNVARYAPPPFMPVMDRTPEPVVLLFDEIDKAKPELQSPLLEVFQFHTINGTPLNIKAIVATANLPDEGAFSKPISGPLANRCSLFKTNVIYTEWQSWAAGAGVNPLITGFLSRNQGYLSQSPDKNDRTAYARPSPRSWTEAGKDLDEYFKDSHGEGAVDFQTLLVGAKVGEPAALLFRVWLEHYRHIEHFVDQLIEDGRMPPPLEIDRTMVMGLAACGAAASSFQKPNIPPNAKAIVKRVFSYINTLPPEIIIGVVKSTFNTQMILKHELQKIPEFKEVFSRISETLGFKKAVEQKEAPETGQ